MNQAPTLGPGEERTHEERAQVDVDLVTHQLDPEPAHVGSISAEQADADLVAAIERARVALRDVHSR